MLSDLVCACDDCDAPLGRDDRQLTMESPDGVQHAYECDCGAVTIMLSGAHRR